MWAGTGRFDGLVGVRVALRHRVGERAGRPLHSDAVGELARWAPGELVVHTRRGPVRVREEAVVAVRAVPAAVPRRPSWAAVAALETVCADATPPPVQRRLGGWRLRAGGGSGELVNAALAAGDPGVPVPVALDTVRAFAAEHGVPPLVRVPLGSPWASALAAAGWAQVGGAVEVLVADVDAVPTGDAGDRGAVRATVVREHVLLAHADTAPADTAHSGRGHPAGSLGAGAEWGRERGARWAVVQAGVADEPRRACYRASGFRPHHRAGYYAPR